MINRLRHISIILLLIAFFIIIVGCTSDIEILEEKDWKLTGWTESSLKPAGFQITADFSEDIVSGNSGVNHYGGDFQAGPGNELSVGQLVTTQMAGPEPAMRAESIYLKLLEQAKTFKIYNDYLRLYDSEGNELLIFRAEEY